MKGWVGKKSEVKGYSHTQVSINATPVSGLPGFLRKEWGGRGGAGQRRQPEKKIASEERKKKRKKGNWMEAGRSPTCRTKDEKQSAPSVLVVGGRTASWPAVKELTGHTDTAPFDLIYLSAVLRQNSNMTFKSAPDRNIS